MFLKKLIQNQKTCCPLLSLSFYHFWSDTESIYIFPNKIFLQNIELLTTYRASLFLSVPLIDFVHVHLTKRAECCKFQDSAMNINVLLVWPLASFRARSDRCHVFQNLHIDTNVLKAVYLPIQFFLIFSSKISSLFFTLMCNPSSFIFDPLHEMVCTFILFHFLFSFSDSDLLTSFRHLALRKIGLPDFLKVEYSIITNFVAFYLNRIFHHPSMFMPVLFRDDLVSIFVLDRLVFRSIFICLFQYFKFQYYSTVTDFARLRGWSTSVPFSNAVR